MAQIDTKKIWSTMPTFRSFYELMRPWVEFVQYKGVKMPFDIWMEYMVQGGLEHESMSGCDVDIIFRREE